jgi:hypothetical protein
MRPASAVVAYVACEAKDTRGCREKRSPYWGCPPWTFSVRLHADLFIFRNERAGGKRSWGGSSSGRWRRLSDNERCRWRQRRWLISERFQFGQRVAQRYRLYLRFSTLWRYVVVVWVCEPLLCPPRWNPLRSCAGRPRGACWCHRDFCRFVLPRLLRPLGPPLLGPPLIGPPLLRCASGSAIGGPFRCAAGSAIGGISQIGRAHV